MAAKGDITANVGINLSGGGLDAVANNLDAKILKIIADIEKIGNSATNATAKGGKAAEAAANKLEGQIKSLQARMGQVQTIAKAMETKAFSSDLGDIKLAKSARAVSDFRKSMDEAVGTAEKLRVRINEISKESANMARQGQTISSSRLRQQEQLNTALKEYERFSSTLTGLQGKATFLNPNSQKQIEGLLFEAQRLKAVFNDLAGDGRRFDFSFLTEAQRNITAEIDKQITALAAQERIEQRLLTNTRARAQALLDVTSRQKQISLEQGAASLVNKLTPTQTGFGNAIGEAGLENRLVRVTTAYNAARVKLQEAVQADSGKSQENIAKLVAQYERLELKIKETIALQARLAKDNAPAPTPATPTKKSPFGTLLDDGGLGLASRVGLYAVAASAVYGVINAIKSGVQFVVEYDDALAQLAAISGATSGQMASLSASIIDVSTNSKFSAVEIAQASVQLAQAGLTADDMTKALKSVTVFAAASGTGVKESVDLMTGALGAFQLQASETARIADVMTVALNQTRLTSQQIGQAIQYVGTTAYEQNISLEQLVATIGAVAQSGVKAGSTLGTGFRQFLIDLTTPTTALKEELDKLGLTVADVDVKVRGLPAVMDTLKNAGFGAAQAYAGLEVRAAAFYLAAKNNIDITKQLALAQSIQGSALAANDRALDSINSQWQRLQNNLSAIVENSSLPEFLRNLTSDLAGAASAIRDYNKAVEERKQREADGTATTADYAQKTSDFAASLVNPILQIGTMIDQYNDLHPKIQKVSEASKEASDAFDKQSQTVDAVTHELDRLLLQGPTLQKDTVQTAIETNNLTARFEGLASQLGTTTDGYYNLIQAMRNYRIEQLKVLGVNAGQKENAARADYAVANQQAFNLSKDIFTSPAFKNLSNANQAEFSRLWTNAVNGQAGATGAINDFANRLRLASPAITKLRNDMLAGSNALGTRTGKAIEANTNKTLGQDIRVITNPIYNALRTGFEQTNAELGQKLSQSAGLDPKARAGLYGSSIARLDKTLGAIDYYLRANKGNDAVTRNLMTLRGDVVSARTSALGQARPTDKENRASARDQRAGAAAARREAANAQREQNKYNSNDLEASSATLKAASATLKGYLGKSKFGVGDFISKLPDFLKEGDDALQSWITARKGVLQDALTKGKFNPDQIKEMTEAANEEIAAKQKEVYGKQIDVLNNSLTEYLKEQGRAIESAYKLALVPFVTRLNRQQGLSEGLNNPLIARGVPDYVKENQSRRVQEAQLDLDRRNAGTRNLNGTWTGGANQDRIDQYEGDLEKLGTVTKALEDGLAQAIKDDDKNKIAQYRRELYDTGVTMEELRAKSEDLGSQNDKLRASFDAAALAPTNFRDAIGGAVEAFRSKTEAGLTINQRLFEGIGGVLDEAHGTFQTFFTDIISGSKSVGQAFGDMAKGIIGAIEQMAAKAVATAIFNLLLSFLPGGGGNFHPGGGGFGTAVQAWRGGLIGNQTPQRLIGGGPVGRGLPTRDSALVYAAKGEFMMNRSSVESIGHDLLSDMNKRGVSALDGLRNQNIVMPQSQLVSNVYAVLPEERPQLGPNDVLAIISRDVLRGGATKGLIKQVAAGG